MCSKEDPPQSKKKDKGWIGGGEEEGSGGGECIQCSTPQQVHLKCEAILEKIILIRAKDSYLK